MATRDSPNGDISLPDAVPFDLPALTRLSWELGSRVVGDDDATLHSEWTRTDRPWDLAVVFVTANTVVIRVRTPVGRERFYGAARQDLERALPRLSDAPQWRRLE